MASEARPLRATRGVIPYIVLLAAAIIGFKLIVSFAAPGASAPIAGASAAAAHDLLPDVLIALTTILIVTRLAGIVFRRMGQPRVIGEIVAGLMLGPSALGAISPDTMHFLIPPAAAPTLGILAQIGVVLFMFLIGLEMNIGMLWKRAGSVALISQSSIVTPFLLGSAFALVIYPRFTGPGVPFELFALFFGVSMSVTAFPVLARILTERGLHRTPLGSTALTCAAIGDAAAWCLLAYVVGVAHDGESAASTGFTVLLTTVFVAFLFVIVRPLLGRWISRHMDPELTPGRTAAFIAAALACALVTQSIGIHALFGAFAFGVIIPPWTKIATQLHDRMGDIVMTLLLPVFFAFTGTRTQIGDVVGMSSWLVCIAIIVIATVGKFGGTIFAARWTGMSWRDGAALGLLMNTRGLVELIVLNLGLDLGVISPPLFTMLVIMAVVTTVATPPLLRLTGIKTSA